MSTAYFTFINFCTQPFVFSTIFRKETLINIFAELHYKTGLERLTINS